MLIPPADRSIVLVSPQNGNLIRPHVENCPLKKGICTEVHASLGKGRHGSRKSMSCAVVNKTCLLFMGFGVYGLEGFWDNAKFRKGSLQHSAQGLGRRI